jgi:hypothetical protein
MTEEPLILPKMLKIKQNIVQQSITDIPKVISQEFQKLALHNTIRPNETIAITAGSRGIRHIAEILALIVKEFQQLGTKPFIFPAMGSHGGGTAEGQRKVLENYGITEESMNCEIKATMKVKIIGKTQLGTPVYLDKFAFEADHIFVVNRIKPHTKFVGKVESGLMKMCLIGMGKREGARTYHRTIAHHSWDSIVDAVTDVIVENLPIIGGLAIVQNAKEELAHLIALHPHEFKDKEPKLLEKAYNLMGKIPFKQIDLLIVDQMGKEMSGTGMDTNITGRKDGSDMQVLRVFIRDLTEKSHGNAQGIGLADFTTQKLVDKINYQATYLNSQTAYRTDTCKIPMTLPNDYEVLKIAQKMAGINDDPSKFKIVWIKNTLELEEFYVSECFRPIIVKDPHMEILKEDLKFDFDDEKGVFLR